MKPDDIAWQRLAAASRRAVDNRDTSAPYGFSTRIAALAFASEPPRTSLFQRFSFRALGFACALMLVSVAANYSVITSAYAGDELTATGDPVAEVLDLSSTS